MFSVSHAPEFCSHDHPRCVHCGDTRGPWRPTGGHCEHGVQLFQCAPGRGCQDRDVIAEREARRRAQQEIDQAHAEAAADAPIRFVTDQAPGSAIVDLGGGDHVTVPSTGSAIVDLERAAAEYAIPAARRYLDSLPNRAKVRVCIVDPEVYDGVFLGYAEPDGNHILFDFGAGDVHRAHFDDIVLPEEYAPATISDVVVLRDNEYPDCSLSAVVDLVEGFANASASVFLAELRKAFEAQRAGRSDQGGL